MAQDAPRQLVGMSGKEPRRNDKRSEMFICATADIRGDYRYSLTRVWDPALPVITFVLLNPSTADEAQLDPPRSSWTIGSSTGVEL
jgi:hypothetical protein